VGSEMCIRDSYDSSAKERTVIYDADGLHYTDHSGSVSYPTASGGHGIIDRVYKAEDGEYYPFRILNLPGYIPDQVLLLGSTPFWPECR